ncbi:MAG: hypothetical protein ACRDVG_02765 [Jatrophihabitantaceae bacterium]
MIRAVAFLPHPPVLVPDVAQGAAAELDDLRAACRVAIARVAAPGRSVVVIGPGPVSRCHARDARGTFAGFGVPVEVGDSGADELPLSLTVGVWLARESGRAVAAAVGIAPDRAVPDLGDGDTALLVMGDASARRSTAAPGYLDERAEGYDAEVARALAAGDPAALGALDLGLGAQLLAAGAPAWAAAATLLGTRTYDAELLYDDAPYGVGYLVAAWT